VILTKEEFILYHVYRVLSSPQINILGDGNQNNAERMEYSDKRAVECSNTSDTKSSRQPPERVAVYWRYVALRKSRATSAIFA